MLSLLPTDAHYIFTRADMRRAAKPEDVAAMAERAGLTCEVAPSVVEAVARAKDMMQTEDMLFIGGSTFVVAEALAE